MRHRTVLLLCTFLFIIPLLIYANSLSNGFAFDDVHIVQHNPLLSSLSNAPRLFTSEYWASTKYATKDSKLFRPLTMLTYLLTRQAAGNNPFAYHLGNVLLHAATTVALFFLLAGLLRMTAPVLEEQAILTASFAGALVFAVHPVHVEAVSGIVGRAEVLAAFFCILSLLSYLDGKKALSLLFFAGGILSKETALMLPALIVLADLLLPQQERKKNYLPYFALAAASLLFKHAVLGGTVSSGSELFFRNEALLARLLTMTKVFALYCKLLFLPYPLNPDWGMSAAVTITHSVADARALMSGVLLIALLAFALSAFARKKRITLASFAILWWFITLFPVSNIIPMGDLMAERFLYLPSIGLSVLAALLFVNKKSRAFKYIFLCLFVLGSAALTIWQNPVWRDNRSLWTYVTRSFPDNWRAHWELGKTFRDDGNDATALELFRKSLRVLETDLVLYDTALLLKKTNPQEAVKMFDRLLAVNPLHAQGYLERGNSREKTGAFASAEQDYEASLRLNAQNDTAWYSRGRYFLQRGNRERANNDFQQALALNPRHTESLVGMGNCAFAVQDYAQAELFYSRALNIEATHREALYNMTILFLSNNETAKARFYYEQLKKLYPADRTLQQLATYFPSYQPGVDR